MRQCPNHYTFIQRKKEQLKATPSDISILGLPLTIDIEPFFWLLVLGSSFGPRAINVPPARFLYALFEPNPFSMEQSKERTTLR